MHRDTAIRRPCRWVLPRILRGGTNSSTAPQTNAFQTRGHVTVGAIVITFIKQFTGNTSLTSNRKRTDAQFFEERTSSSSTSTILDPFLKNIYIYIYAFVHLRGCSKINFLNYSPELQAFRTLWVVRMILDLNNNNQGLFFGKNYKKR